VVLDALAERLGGDAIVAETDETPSASTAGAASRSTTPLRSTDDRVTGATVGACGGGDQAT
jgi:hypothetical protein